MSMFPEEPALVPPYGGGLPISAEHPAAVPPPGGGVSRRSCTTRHINAKYGPVLREFLLQCPHCRANSRQSYWPLTLEFWSQYTLSICRACKLEADRHRAKKRRENPEIRAKSNAQTAAWRKAHGTSYSRPTLRAWRAANRERDRAQNRARYLRRKAAAA